MRSKLAHPTSYHVSAIQKRQVNQYLSSQGVPAPFASHSAPSQHTSNFGLGRGMGHAANMATFSVRKDPMLSGVTNVSPQRPSPIAATSDSSAGLFGSHPQTLNIKAESPTLMATDTPENVRRV